MEIGKPTYFSILLGRRTHQQGPKVSRYEEYVAKARVTNTFGSMKYKPLSGLINILCVLTHFFTYAHRSKKIGDPVRSRVLKLGTGGLVLRSVTTWEYSLAYVFAFFFLLYYLFVWITGVSLP